MDADTAWAPLSYSYHMHACNSYLIIHNCDFMLQVIQITMINHQAQVTYSCLPHTQGVRGEGGRKEPGITVHHLRMHRSTDPCRVYTLYEQDNRHWLVSF